MIEYKIKIKRYNPNSQKDYWQIFSLKTKNNITILEVLNYIKSKIDDSLTFRSFCRSAICGSCSVVVNNNSKLACKTKVEDVLIDGIITIEPLNNLPIIKDLVVNKDIALDKLKTIKPYIKKTSKVVPTTIKYESIVFPEEFAKYDKESDCILCMSCYSDCSALEANKEYIGPFALAKLYRYIMDLRDDEKLKNRLKLVQSNGIWDCVQCQKCLSACPKGLRPAENILELRRLSKDVGFENIGIRRAKNWFADVYKTGQIDKWHLPQNAYANKIGKEITKKLAKEFKENGLKEDEFAPQPFEGIEKLQRFIQRVQREII